MSITSVGERGSASRSWPASASRLRACTSSTDDVHGPRPVRAPRGTELTCRGWQQEAALRMLMNNLDPEVAEDPDHLVVYGGTGRAARSWEAFDAIVRELRRLADDETLLVQSGKPVGVFRTHPWAPRVLIANSNLVGKWATWERLPRARAAGPDDVRPDDRRVVDLHRDPGHPAGHVRDVRRGRPASTSAGRCAGRVTLTAGLGGMGGAQPLAVTMNDGVCIAIEVDEARARRRLDIGYVDRLTHDPAEALAWAREAAAAGEAVSIALVGNAAEIEPAWAAAGERFDLVTDQTSAHDALGGYVPAEMTLADALELRARAARRVPAPLAPVDGRPRPGDARLPARPARSSSTTATTCAPRPRRPASRTPSTTRASCPAFIRPQFCEGRGPFRWARPVRRSGRHRPDRPGGPGALPRRRRPAPLDRDGPGSGSRSRACRPGSAGSATASGRRPGWRSTSWSGPARSARRSSSGATTSTPGSVASPNRETEAMLDGSDAVADWPLLNALVNTAAGATWVSIHHGGGVGIGYSQHAGMVVVADGTDARGAEAGAGPDDGPGDGRPAPRRRRLRARDRGRPRARRPRPDARED